mmetsp:Transcript_48380/g.121115  ORF Transcript_48380/g.121115 Transcript_48380/m.121115 type:complete len:80 (-) Transcript_48380:253-492(-)
MYVSLPAYQCLVIDNNNDVTCLERDDRSMCLSPSLTTSLPLHRRRLSKPIAHHCLPVGVHAPWWSVSLSILFVWCDGSA